MPYLADAVPGWFQAAVTLYDDQGNELAYAGGYRFHPDPVLHYEIPRDGRYLVEIRDAIYRGREDFVYRMALGELPFVTGVFPLGGRAGQQTRVELQGWNLPSHDLTRTAKAGRRASIRSDCPRHGLCRGLPFALDTCRSAWRRSPTAGPDRPARSRCPSSSTAASIVPATATCFRFEGHAGQTGRRRGLRPAARLAAGFRAAADRRRRAGNWPSTTITRTRLGPADPSCRFLAAAKLPAAGTYYLRLYDAQGQGGPEYAYRLRIGPPRPDFQLRIVPSTRSVRAGLSVPVTVQALRRDGFNGEITLELQDPPPGFSLSGVRILPGQDRVRMTLTAPPDPDLSPVELHMQGQATIAGRQVRRPAVPADDMMQAFIYHHLVPARQWLIAIVGRARNGPA